RSTARRTLPRNEPEPSPDLAAVAERPGIAQLRDEGAGCQWANATPLHQPPARLVRDGKLLDARGHPRHFGVKVTQPFSLERELGSHQRWQTVLRVFKYAGQRATQLTDALGGDDPELGHHASKLVDRRRSRLDRPSTQSVKSKNLLLFNRLERHKAHRGSQ